MLCSFGSIWIFRLVHLSWDQCHFIQGRLRSWLQGRQAGWFRRWIAVCEGGTVGAAVGFAVGIAECEGIRLYTGVRTRLVTKIVLVTRIWADYCRLMVSKIDIILLKNCDMDLTFAFIKADLTDFRCCKITFFAPQYRFNCLLVAITIAVPDMYYNALVPCCCISIVVEWTEFFLHREKEMIIEK
jgi:hypothetical protein